MSTATEATEPDRVAALDPVFAQMLGATARHVRAVPELTEREKTFHIGRALRAGATVEDLRAALRFPRAVRVTRAWEAWKALGAHIGREHL